MRSNQTGSTAPPTGRRRLRPLAVMAGVCMLSAGTADSSSRTLSQRLLGIDRDLGNGSMRLEWPSAPTGDGALFTIVGIIAASVAVLVLYRIDTSRARGWAKLTLPLLRIAAMAIAVAMLLRPVVVFEESIEEPSHVVIAADVSESMTARDSWSNASEVSFLAKQFGFEDAAAVRESPRYELLRRGVERIAEPLRGDDERVVHVHPFGRGLDGEVDSLPAMLDAPSAITAVAKAIEQTRSRYEGRPLAGIVLLTDGVSTATTSLASVDTGGIPVFAVPVGTVEGPRNVRVAEVDVSPFVFVDDTAEITARIVHRGMQDQRVRVAFEKRVGGGVWTLFHEADELLDGTDNQVSISTSFTESKPGPVEFRVLASIDGTELTPDDNVAFAQSQVVREKLRVLLIAGSTFPEIQFLRNAYYRDKTIELSSWLQAASDQYRHPGNAPIRRLPSTDEELNAYDCVILYDPHPGKWPANFPDLLTRFVTQSGGGLALIAGELQTERLFDQQDDPALSWLRLMPVIRERGLFRSSVQMKLSARTPFNLKITPAGQSSEILRFDEDIEKNRLLLEDLPGMFWHFPVTRAKPGAEVLAVHGDPRMRNEYGQEILIAEQRVGPGRTLFLAFDSTYRWRYWNEDAFNGFWRRVAGRAGRAKRLGGGYPFKLSTARSEFEPNSEVRVRARFLVPDGPEAAVDQLAGEVQRGTDEPIPITLDPTGQPGEFAGTFLPQREGTYLTRVWLGEINRGTRAATLPIEVRDAGRELVDPTVDRDALTTLASSSGGAVIELSDLDSLPDLLTIGRVTRTTESREEVWDAPLVWGSLFVALCLEWWLRKRARLI